MATEARKGQSGDLAPRRRISVEGEEGDTRPAKKHSKKRKESEKERAARKRSKGSKEKASSVDRTVEEVLGTSDEEELADQLEKDAENARERTRILAQKLATTTAENTGKQAGKKTVTTLVEQKQQGGLVQTTLRARLVFTRAVRKHLFCHVKFVTSHSHLDYGARICNKLLKKLDLNMSDTASCKKYWLQHRSSVNKTLNQRRGNVNGEIQKKFMGT
jgi:hypothetical protein